LIKNKKIAILGSTPVMIILFYCLKSKNKIFIFDNNKILGGAWKKKNYGKKFINAYSNVVLPTNDSEYKNQIQINTFLKKKKIGISIKRSKKEINVSYKPKKYFEYNFDKLYLKLKNYKKNIRNIKIKNITLIKDNKVLLNNKYEFDFVFFPSFFGLNFFFQKNKKVFINFKLIQSKHISIIAKKMIGKLFYSDFYNEFFDRINTYKYKNFFHLTARVSKKIKHLNNIQLKKIIFNNFPFIEIKKIFFNKFDNFYRNKNQIINLQKKLNSKKIVYVNTSSFILGVCQIKNLLLKY
jgi:hypothetical protein